MKLPKAKAAKSGVAGRDRGATDGCGRSWTTNARHIGMLLALHGAKPIPEYNPSKEKHWGRRKLKRDE
jgi:hypothetical protein